MKNEKVKNDRVIPILYIPNNAKLIWLANKASSRTKKDWRG